VLSQLSQLVYDVRSLRRVFVFCPLQMSDGDKEKEDVDPAGGTAMDDDDDEGWGTVTDSSVSSPFSVFYCLPPAHD
jgi:hypothetical protein